MTYWTLTPLIAVIGVFFFAGTYVVYKHQFLYLFSREYETGGTYFYGLFDNSMFCLVISASLITAYVSIREGISQAALLLPLPFATYYFWCSITNKFKHRSDNMAYNCAVSGDLNDPNASHQATGLLLQSLSKEGYMQPSLTSEVMETIPYPHRINNEPLLVRAAANEAPAPSIVSITSPISSPPGGSSTHSGSGGGSGRESGSGKNKKANGVIGGIVTSISDPRLRYIALNNIYYDDITPSTEDIDNFYAGLRRKYFPNSVDDSDNHSQAASSNNSRSNVDISFATTTTSDNGRNMSRSYTTEKY